MNTKNIVITGVGGQGSLLACNLIGSALLLEGFDAKVSEVHGMSQRGGSVVTYVRYGDKVHSPIVDDGQADILVSFELLEAARWFHLLAPGGTIITNTQQIDPMPVIIGNAKYPTGILDRFINAGAKVEAVDALSLAKQAGSQKAVNIVMIGSLSEYLPLKQETWERAIEETVPAKLLEINKKAFQSGKQKIIS